MTIDLNALREPNENPSDQESDAFQLELKNARLEQLKLKNKELEAAVISLENANNQREPVQSKLWSLIKAWLICVLVIVFLSGFESGLPVPLCCKSSESLHCFRLKLHYDSSVLVALITTPTVSIIGLVTIFLKYLFPNREAK